MSKAAYHELKDSLATIYDRENRSTPRLFARYIVSLLPLDDEDNDVMPLHDNACGPAVFTGELLTAMSSPSSRQSFTEITATDKSHSMIGSARDLIKRRHWTGVETMVADSMNLNRIPDEMFGTSVTNFRIFMLASPIAGAAEVYRTLMYGGAAYITAWKARGWLDLLGRIGRIVRPDAAQEISNETDITYEMIEDTMVGAGVPQGGIQIHEHREWLKFEDETDLGVLMGTGKLAMYATQDWDEDQRRRIPEVVKEALSEEEWEMKAIAMDAWVVKAHKF